MNRSLLCVHSWLAATVSQQCTPSFNTHLWSLCVMEWHQVSGVLSTPHMTDCSLDLQDRHSYLWLSGKCTVILMPTPIPQFVLLMYYHHMWVTELSISLTEKQNSLFDKTEHSEGIYKILNGSFKHLYENIVSHTIRFQPISNMTFYDWKEDGRWKWHMVLLICEPRLQWSQLSFISYIIYIDVTLH